MHRLPTIATCAWLACAPVAAETVEAPSAQRVGAALVAQAKHDGLTLGCAVTDAKARSLLIFLENESGEAILIDPSVMRLTSIKRKGRKLKRSSLKLLSPEQHRVAEARKQAALSGTGKRGSGDPWSASSTAGTAPDDPGQPIMAIGSDGSVREVKPTRRAGEPLARDDPRWRNKPARKLKYLSADWGGDYHRDEVADLERLEVGPGEGAAGLIYFQGRVADLLEMIVPIGEDEYLFVLDLSSAD